MDIIIEKDIAGPGILRLPDGSLIRISYSLTHYQTLLRSQAEGGTDAMVRGSKHLRGWIYPVCCVGAGALGLRLEDGRRINLSVTDRGGYCVGSFVDESVSLVRMLLGPRVCRNGARRKRRQAIGPRFSGNS
jgi:hypothetical protein